MADLSERMRADWNRRAREDAHYYAAFGRRGQQDEEFEASAADLLRDLRREMRRLGPERRWSALRVLDLGCGPGRAMLPLSRQVGEIHGVDVSDEMARLARKRLAGAPNAQVHLGSGSDLGMFADDWFDFGYSYAVLQHIPSREVVFNYLAELRRVLRPGGVLRCQMNGLPGTAACCDTWSGVRVRPEEVRRFALDNDMQLLAMEGAGTQYLSVTLRKRPRGWRAQLAARPPAAGVRIRRIANAYGAGPLAASRGRFAAVSLGVETLPEECGLLDLEARIGGLPGKPFYLGPESVDGLREMRIVLPEGIATGLQPVELLWFGRALGQPATLRVAPPAPAAPRVVGLSDAVDLLAGRRIQSGAVKIILEEVEDVSQLCASLDGEPVAAIESFCVDPAPPRYEVNLRLPAGIAPGERMLELRLGRRRFPPVRVVIVQAENASSDVGS